MRTILFLSLILLGACTAGAAAMPVEPMAHLVFGDLVLESAADRAELRARVANAVREFCRYHEDEVTPQVLRHDRFYCFERVRSTMVADMPRDVRRAYKQAMREAGAHGRRL